MRCWIVIGHPLEYWITLREHASPLGDFEVAPPMTSVSVSPLDTISDSL